MGAILICVPQHDGLSETVTDVRLRMHVKCKAPKGSTYIYLPRSFRGFLYLRGSSTRPSSVIYSKAVISQLTPLSVVGGDHRSFLGRPFNVSEWGSNSEWDGDELVADAAEYISIYFDDEGKIPTGDSGGCICV